MSNLNFNRHDKNNLANFNEQDYCYAVILENQSGKKVKLKPEAIEELVIEDTFLKMYTTGYIIIRNDYDALERTTDTAKALFPNAEDAEYFFRGDGRDLLTIDVFPHFETHSLSLKPKDWLLHVDAVVYDVEDIPTENPHVKLKKLYFWDEFYQRLLDKNLEWSTADLAASKAEKPIEKLTNAERSVLVGEAIIDLLRTAGLEDQIDESLFDMGGSENQIFYTSPAQSFAIDDLHYLLRRHVSETGSEPCFLRCERSEETEGTPQKFSLRPLSYYFERAGKKSPGEYQTEHFFIQERADDVANTKSMFMLPRAPIDQGSADLSKDVKMAGFNSIFTYRFTAMAGIDNNKALVNRPVLGYDAAKKLFSFEVQEHTAEKCVSVVRERYLQHVKQEGSENELITLNNQQTTGNNTMPGYSLRPTKEGRKADGINKILMGAMFLNHSINFTVRGLTLRQSGRFIAIDKMHQFVHNEFDHRLLGQWFVVSVTHRFSNRTYQNDITALKIHSYKSLNDIPRID